MFQLKRGDDDEADVMGTTVAITESSYSPMTTTEDTDWLTHPPDVTQVR